MNRNGDDAITLHHGNCLDVLSELPDCSMDSVVTDPPYGLANTTPAQVAETITRWVNGDRDYIPTGAGFMGRSWDAFVPPVAVWDECLRVLKPGGHVLAFAGSRTHDLMTLALRLAGFEIRDSVAWMYGSGFPKSLDVSKAIDKAARGVPQGGIDPTSPNHGQYRTTTTEGKRWDSDKGQGYGAGGSRFLTDTASERTIASTIPTTTAQDAAAADGSPPPTLDATATDWQGWGTALKPAFEPVVMARKPIVGTVASNVLAHGTGGLNVDGCRTNPGESVPGGGGLKGGAASRHEGWKRPSHADGYATARHAAGCWPANVILDESQAESLDQQSGVQRDGVAVNRNKEASAEKPHEVYGGGWLNGDLPDRTYGGTGGASRFFYVAKADASERVRVDGISHPTVKPLSIMRWLVRLVTPPGGTVLEPFAGSGTTVEACILEGFRCVAIEREDEYLPLIRQRINRRRDPVKAVRGAGEDLGLFDLLGDGA